jgi:hypothetical protein
MSHGGLVKRHKGLDGGVVHYVRDMLCLLLAVRTHEQITLVFERLMKSRSPITYQTRDEELQITVKARHARSYTHGGA